MSNVGCEYWAVDADIASEGTGINAEQQYAIGISNHQPDHPVEVVVEQDDGEVGGERVCRWLAEPRSIQATCVCSIWGCGRSIGVRLGRSTLGLALHTPGRRTEWRAS
ncbi:MAG: hypothetical protein FWD57_09920 [Polyangiaceae bacterium]|nr:hypothetical protein [Polyangiaceae bacterium]